MYVYALVTEYCIHQRHYLRRLIRLKFVSNCSQSYYYSHALHMYVHMVRGAVLALHVLPQLI